MDHSSQPQIEDEIVDVVEFLIRNKKVIISDLKKEYKEQIEEGRSYHKGFALRAFHTYIEDILCQRIRDMYTFSKRWYITSETVMLIDADDDVRKLVNKIIKEIVK